MIRISPENYLRRLWHDGCPKSGVAQGVMRYVSPEQTLTHDDGSALHMAECLHCGARGYIGLDKSRRIIVREARPDDAAPTETKCARTACENRRATCRHTQTGRMYCRPCAHKINAANPEHPGLVEIPAAPTARDEARPDDAEVLGNIVAAVEASKNYAAMSNRELVAACLSSHAANYLVVNAMMDRLDPGWSKEMRIAEATARGEARPDDAGVKHGE